MPFVTRILKPDQLTANIIAVLIVHGHGLIPFAALNETAQRLEIDVAQGVLDGLVNQGILGYDITHEPHELTPMEFARQENYTPEQWATQQFNLIFDKIENEVSEDDLKAGATITNAFEYELKKIYAKEYETWLSNNPAA